jgi:hypothetical protein
MAPRKQRPAVVVAGSGMAGASLARELLQAGHEVTMVSTGSRSGVTESARSGWFSRTGHYDPAPGLTGRLGGRAALWSGVVLPVDGDILGSWPQPLPGVVQAGYERVTAQLAGWAGTMLGRPTCPADEVVAERLADQGFRVVPHAARPGCRALNPFERLDPAAFRLIDGQQVVDASGSPGAFQVTLADEETGARSQLTAEALVFAAGTLENTRLLAQTLERVCGETRLVWPGLATKVKHGVLTRPAEWITETLSAGDVVYLVSEHPELRANLFFEVRTVPGGSGPEETVLDLWWFAEQSAGELATVRFRPVAQAHSTPWPGEIECLLGPGDQALMLEREAFADRLLHEWGCATVAPGTATLPGRAAAGLAFAGHPVRYRNPLGLSHHESGTTAVGVHLDTGFQSVQVPGLVVAGPSAFPRAGAANPGLTILALAEHVAHSVANAAAGTPGAL